MKSPLSIENISKAYGKHKVLDNLSLDLKSGEIFGLIGLNGIGKTTLIKCVLQLAHADSGNVTLFDTPAMIDSSRQNLAYLPEKFHPSKHLRGYEYLELCLDYYGLKLNKNEAMQTAQDLELDAKALGNRISSYSKGMGQKIGLIGAFLSKRPLLILDEPMSGLDPKARIALKKKLINYRNAGNTIFFSSHILADIDEICDRVAIIHDTKIRYLGTPSGFKDQYPDTSLEASFLKAIAA
ncbi:MAG: ABC transporter ATP-binding protein [Rickettsiales bacterium]|nr:ABC transporter ATP-binding protein [Rickettsiales bacterium]